jgi:hypothetical protein
MILNKHQNIGILNLKKFCVFKPKKINLGKFLFLISIN